MLASTHGTQKNRGEESLSQNLSSAASSSLNPTNTTKKAERRIFFLVQLGSFPYGVSLETRRIGLFGIGWCLYRFRFYGFRIIGDDWGRFEVR